MRGTRHIRTLALGALAWAGAATAEPENYESLSQELTAIFNQQMTLQQEGREREERLAKALARGTHDSEEMKATRARIQKLNNELLDAQRLLKEQFEALPAVQADVKKSKEDMARLRALDARRLELMRKRDAFLEKSRPRKPEAAPTEEAPATPAPAQEQAAE